MKIKCLNCGCIIETEFVKYHGLVCEHCPDCETLIATDTMTLYQEIPDTIVMSYPPPSYHDRYGDNVHTCKSCNDQEVWRYDNYCSNFIIPQIIKKYLIVYFFRSRIMLKLY